MGDLANALTALQSMPRAQGWCLGHTRAALVVAGLQLPPPMAPPNDTAYANYCVLAQNPAAYGWTAVQAADPSPIKLVYFQNIAPISNPTRFAGHIGLLSNGWIYSDSNYQWDPWWASYLAGMFIPSTPTPTLVVATQGGASPSIDGYTYTTLSCTWDPDQSSLDVQTAQLQQLLGTSVGGLAPIMRLRDALNAINVTATFNLTHMQDPTNPCAYMFVG